MGTWALPFDSLKDARRLKRLMSKPWIAKVWKNEEEGWYDFHYAGFELIGSDNLLDDLGEAARKKKKNFDIRPFVKRELRGYFAQPEVFIPDIPLNIANTVRTAIGLKPVKEQPNMEAKQIPKHRRKGLKIVKGRDGRLRKVAAKKRTRRK